MKPFLISAFLLLSLSSISQRLIITDSTLDEMCKTLITKQNKLLSDSDRINYVLDKLTTPFTSGLSETEQSDLLDYVFFRMQRNCKEFKSILDRLTPNNGDWVAVDNKPFSNLKEKDYQEFIKIEKFFYRESSGDTARVVVSNSIWEDHFKDGTYSRLKLRWLKNAEFQIEFIESNNQSRKNFSKPGDKYNYQLLEKYNNKYKLSVEIDGAGQFSTFYMYFENR